MIQHGLKCRNCSLIVHKSCKNFVIVDCQNKLKYNSSMHSLSQTNNVDNSDQNFISPNNKELIDSSPIHCTSNYNNDADNLFL